ncbi:MAG: 2-amino-4-hydroxy-6-hydroxymethyldihydropteridine diphosphokinase [Nitrospirae bacterium]|nr:2-amino-4-hydroxy-6-hydroxymethyldihydropteridine diphosphokinase [Nitrospirota bacterium]NTW67311.1 2-amino-4-hydroxy-6-hydroxymethyldihydropteridine diphosphokinase [Nitrospirota bacterium]
MPVIAYIGIGSNVGDREANCRKAIELLAKAGRIVRISSLYRTEPVGYHEQDDFINAVAAVETDCAPDDLLRECHAIEDRLGRKRGLRWGPRTADLDILLYGSQVVNQPGLAIPHPRMSMRKFVLIPLVEIAPDAVNPQLNRTAAQLLDELNDRHIVMKCSERSGTP